MRVKDNEFRCACCDKIENEKGGQWVKIIFPDERRKKFDMKVCRGCALTGTKKNGIITVRIEWEIKEQPL